MTADEGSGRSSDDEDAEGAVRSSGETAGKGSWMVVRKGLGSRMLGSMGSMEG